MRWLTVEGPGKPIRKAAGPVQSPTEILCSFSFDKHDPCSIAVSGRRFWEKSYVGNVGGKAGFCLQMCES